MTKELVAQAIEELPNSFPLDELIERLSILEAVEKGRQQYREGKTFTQEEIEAQFRDRWLQ